ncbi:MAG: hypothetical protein IKF46_01140 [Erysipelotrichaceae bacterium]|nr:hypothetical protein [Erysipelotrichaceae bacterium]
MIRNFKEMEDYVLKTGIKKVVALANAQDDVALSALVEAKKKGIVEDVLIGDSEKITEILKRFGEDPADHTIIECETERPSADLACSMIKEGKADIPMKGLMQTSNFMRAILNKEMGFFPAGSLLSQATVLQDDEHERMVVITDCAVNITPNVDEKEKITRNAVVLAHQLGIEKPNIAFLSAVEYVNPKIPSTVDAAELVKRHSEGAFPGSGYAAGPLALDNVVSKEAAEHKGIHSPVCGDADIIVVPDLCSGNIFTKALNFYAHTESSGTLNGADIPVIMTSRTDTPKDKYYAILTAVFQSIRSAE